MSNIKCGSYTGNGSTTGPTVTLGWEPQWVMIKGTQSGVNWNLFDAARGMGSGTDPLLWANDSLSESGIGSVNWIEATATGFDVKTTSGDMNSLGIDYIYVAIRKEGV